jgi:predicted phage tail protein
MVTVYLYGELGRLFGKVWRLDVSSPKEAIRAIQMNGMKIYEYLIDKANLGTEYRVLLDGKDFDSELEVQVPIKKHKTYHFIPVPQGGEGLWQAIIGAVLIVVGIAVNYFSGGSLALLGNALIMSGIAMFLGGVFQLLFPPSSAKAQEAEKSGSRPNYLFSGIVNTTRQGGPVPVGYGRMIVGSQLISAGITTTEPNRGNGDGANPNPNEPEFEDDATEDYDTDNVWNELEDRISDGNGKNGSLTNFHPPSETRIKQANSAKILEFAEMCHFNKGNLGISAIRDYLKTIRAIFDGRGKNHSVKKSDAYNLYQRLPGLPNRNMGQETTDWFVLRIAYYYAYGS